MNISNQLERSTIQAIGMALAGGILGYGLLGPPLTGVERDIQVLYSVFFATVLLWVTKPVPYMISSLLCLILLHMSNVTETFADAAVGFTSTLVFFFILLLLIGNAIANVGLVDRIIGWLIHATSTPESSMRRLVAATLLLTFVMPSGLARTVTFIPVIDNMNNTFGQKSDSPFRRLGYYVIGHLNSVGSMTLMTSGGMAIVTAEIINTRVQPFTWVEWALYMIPPVVAIYLTTIAVAAYFHDISNVSISKREIEPLPGQHTEKSESLTGDQKIVVLTFTGTICLWIVGSFVNLPAIVPAMIMVTLFSLPKVRIITAEDIRNLNWNLIFLIGTMLSLAEIIRSSGSVESLVEAFMAGSTLDQGMLAVVVLLCFAAAVRVAFSGTAPVVVILLPIFLQVIESFEIDPLFFSLSLVMILSSTVLFPFNHPSVLLAYEEGPLSVIDIIFLGFLTLMVAVLAVIIAWYVYWPSIEAVFRPIISTSQSVAS
ncbi:MULTISPECIES: SLC13 family permease [Haloferacaceae]|uniref:SLC13 family permease n=1 Tax=Halorubrum glutamatedens TaxID=2707018 RepID=A0ABD5QMX1_9EURY|nr:SLC13 family permease [Halobellus captivus]